MMKIYISASLKRSEDQQKQLGIPSGQQLTPAGCCKCPYLLKHFPLQFTMSPLPPVTAFSSILNTSDYLCLTTSLLHLTCVCVLSRVRLFATPWTVTCQASLSTEFSRQKYWSGLPFPTLGHLTCLTLLDI